MFVKFLQIPTLFMFVFFVSACGSEGSSSVTAAEDYFWEDINDAIVGTTTDVNDALGSAIPEVPGSAEKKEEGLT